jgi:CRISPR-associated endonuclease/helicase Cas3
MAGATEMPSELLAKSAHRTYGTLSLERHLFETEEAARCIFDRSQRAAQNFVRFFRLDPERDFERFSLSLRVAALFHDIGKANAHFYSLVARLTSDAQAVRHEHFSALVLCLPEVREWLSKSARIDYDAIVAAVLSHHIKAAKPQSDEWAWCQPSRKGKVQLYLAHDEIRRTLERVREIVGLDPVPSLPTASWGADDPQWQSVLRDGADRADRCRRVMMKAEQSEEARRARQLLIAVKTALVAADGVSSATFREGLSIEQWVRGTLHRPAITADDITRDVIDQRIASLRAVGRWTDWHRFQDGAAAQPERSLLIAGCGAGKTLAAWKWIARQCGERSVGRVLFLYPTRGTATEGFKDYVAWAPEADAALLHGTAGYELDSIRSNPPEAAVGKDFSQTESQQRLFALGHWSKRIFSATVDQFLSFMEHGYQSVCLLPVLADSVVVLDEVHSYDPSMFANVLSFLRAFDVPVLAMTATLPSARREAIAHVGLSVYPQEADRDALADLDEQERHARYRVTLASHRDEAMAACVDGLAKNQRVLWVVNTVARAQSLARELTDKLGEPVLCYHSRYKLGDRRAAHEAVVGLFKTCEGACVAVTTQVCEMSLDLDADVLITELAPWPALVQRMGRANRHRRRGDDFRATVVLYAPEQNVPYAKQEIEASRRAAEELGTAAERVSQRMLAELLEKHSADEARRDNVGRLLSSGWYAVPGSLRDEDDFARPCVLDEDLPRVLAKLKAKEHINDFLVPVPKRCAIDVEDERRRGLPAWYGVARSEDYCEELGFIAVPEGA